MKNHIRHVLYKTIGTPNIIRIIEWRSLFEYLHLKGDERILDVACGGWTLSLKIAEKGCEVHGIDLSEDAISYAKRLAEREKIACEFEVGNAEDLPYPDGYFDKVVFSSSLEHIGDDIKALKEACGVLKPNGNIVLTVPSLTYLIGDKIKERHRKIAYVVNYYTHETMKNKFEMTGFSMVRSKYLLNSRITTFFCKIGIKLGWSGILWFSMFPMAYLCLVSDKLFGVKYKGYTLIAEGEKLATKGGVNDG
jgi:ubiquinone/menaquinone biosynthesis C-methylase UbiE